MKDTNGREVTSGDLLRVSLEEGPGGWKSVCLCPVVAMEVGDEWVTIVDTQDGLSARLVLGDPMVAFSEEEIVRQLARPEVNGDRQVEDILRSHANYVSFRHLKQESWKWADAEEFVEESRYGLIK